MVAAFSGAYNGLSQQVAPTRVDPRQLRCEGRRCSIVLLSFIMSDSAASESFWVQRTLSNRPAYRSNSTPIILVSEHFRSWHKCDMARTRTKAADSLGPDISALVRVRPGSARALPYSCSSAIILATRALHPVWCEAPRPRPLSPSKYSWKRT